MMKYDKKPLNITALVRTRMEQGGDRLWRMEDFNDCPPLPVAQALSRLTKSGFIQRISKGVYYVPRKTSFGQSRPNPAKLHRLATKKNKLLPSGITAANKLGFCTQAPNRGEISTTATSLPRKLIGDKTVVHTRRPIAWERLSETEVALLEFIRSRGKDSELSSIETIKRLIKLLKKNNHFVNIAKIADSEPPRVRALLGAMGEQIKANPKLIASLYSSLNPLSRFDFGLFIELPNATKWQAKKES